MHMLPSFWSHGNCMAPMFLQATGHYFVICIHPSHPSSSSVSRRCVSYSLSLQRSLHEGFLALQQLAQK